MMRPATLSCSLLLAISLTGTDVLMAQTGAGCTDDSVTSGSPCGSKLVRSGNFTGRLVVLGQNGEILAPINPGKSPDFEITWDSDQAFSFQLPFSDARRAGFLGTETRSGYSVDTTEVYKYSDAEIVILKHGSADKATYTLSSFKYSGRVLEKDQNAGRASNAKRLAVPFDNVTLRDVLERNLTAIGGAAAVKAIRSLRVKAEISDGNSMIGTMVMQLKRPKGIRVDAALGPQAADDGHRSETKVWDGISGWQTIGDSPAQTLTVWPGPYAVDVDVIESAVGGLQYLQSPGRELTLIGRKDYWLSGHFAIQVKGRGPEVVTYYVHPESYLVTGAITEIPGPNPRTVETLFSDYRDVAGVKLAFSMEVREAGGTLQRSRFVSVEPNAFIDDGVFVNAQTAVSPQSVVGRAASRVPVGSPASLQDQKRSTAMAVSERILHETDGSLTRLGLAKGSVAGGWMLDGRDVSAPVFAADNASFAYVKAGGNGLVAVMNGVPGQAYGYLRQSEFRLSPDGVRLAYVAGRGDRRFVVVDGTEGQSWDEVGRLLFSPDSRHLLYVAKSAGKHVIVLDGRILGEPTDSFGEGTFAFSPDSSHIAYVVINGGKGTVMVDGAAVSKAGDRPSGDAPVFSPDSRRLAYRAGRGARALVVCDGVEGKLYDGVSKPTFSPDSKQVAHLAQDASGVFVVVNGEEKRSVTPKGEPVFSPDSRHVGWIGGRGGRVFAVIDDKEDPPYDDAGFLKWSADSGQYAYHALTGRAHVIVVGKTPGKPAVGVTEMVASPTGRRFGYAAMRSDGKWVVVVDGLESEAFDSVREGSPVFSPDGQHVAFAAERDGKWHLVVDGTPSRAYDGEFVGAPVFAGSEVRGIAKDGNKYVQVLVSLKGWPGRSMRAR